MTRVSIFVLFSVTQNEMEKLETLREDAMSGDAESQDENQSLAGVSPRNEVKFMSTDAKDNSFLKTRGKRTPVRKNSKEDKMKSIRNNQRSNSQSKDVKENPRKAHDLKQKVRKVRFFLPFTASLESKRKVGQPRSRDRTVNADDVMATLVTQLRNLRTTHSAHGSNDTYSENETGTIEEESVGTESYFDGSEGGYGEVACKEEADDRSKAGSVSESSVTSSRSFNRKNTQRETSSSGDEAKVFSGGSRIFPRGGVNPPGGGVNTPNFPENCMKSKEFGRPGGGVRPSRPPRSANGIVTSGGSKISQKGRGLNS